MYETRSVGRAAHELDMSQPGLSTALMRLRATLHDPLFVKTAKGMEPTHRSKTLYDTVKSIVDSIESKVLTVTPFEPLTETREFRIGLSDVGEAIYMPLAIRTLDALAPGVTLRSVSLPPTQLLAAMSRGEVDLAAGYFPDIRTSDFVHRRIGLHSFACIVRTGHPLSRGKMTLARYLAARHVAVEANARSQEVLENFLAQKRLRRPIGLRTPHFMSLPMIISQTNLIATVPQALADFMSTGHGIQQIKLPFTPPTFQANMHWSRNAHLDPANIWLRQTLFDAFSVISLRAYDRNGAPRAPAPGSRRAP